MRSFTPISGSMFFHTVQAGEPCSQADLFPNMIEW